MPAGDRDFLGSSREVRFTSQRRLLSVALALAAAAGCGRSSPDPASSSPPPLPRYWHGSIEGPRPNAWADAWPREWSTDGPAPVEITASPPAEPTEPYDVPKLPPAAVASDSSAPQEHRPSNADSTGAAPTAAAAYGESLADEPSPGILLPPEPVDSIADRTSPAPSKQRTAALSPGAPTGAVVNERATSRIRRGFELAERGAYFAARNEFVDVLRMIASAKDQIHGSPRRTLALADGLRGLEEAADFRPAAGAGELRLAVIVASHQTPVAKSLSVEGMLPEQLADAYLEYAGRQLGAAVAGEPTGSMALHALGKLHSRLGRVEPEANPQADRCAFALQQAALLARSDNHMAAHELGVLLAEGGHLAESGMMLRQVAERAPDPVVFRNLARVESQLGRLDLAAAYQRSAELIASRGNSPGGPVQWVSPATLARTPDPLSPPANSMMARGAATSVRR